MPSSNMAFNLSIVHVTVLGCIVALLTVFYNLFQRYRKPCDLPVLNLEGWDFERARERFITDLFHYLQSSRQKDPDQAIQLYGPEGYIVIIPERFIGELKALDDSVQDNLPLWTDILSDYLFLDISKGGMMRKLISTHLNAKLSKLIPEIVDELAYAMHTEMPANDVWEPVKLNKRLPRIVSLLSGRLFVGKPLNRDEDWLETNNTFSEDIYGAGVHLKQRSYLGKLVTVLFSTVPELRRINKCKKIAHELFIPEIREREILLQKDEKTELPDDAISWSVKIAATEKKPTTHKQLAELQLLLSMASIHTSRSTITSAVYDLLARPEYLEPLRAEVDAAWEKCGGIDSTFPARLVLLDSFLKESQRLSPVGQLTFDRRVTARKGLTLSNGLHLRQGAHVAVAAHQISLDPRIWHDPTEFHGFRFSDLRAASPDQQNKFQFATTDPANSLNFGYGNHDCPGRFFASTEIKIVLAFLLREYDLKASPDCVQRPRTNFWAQRMSPESDVMIMMRKRATTS